MGAHQRQRGWSTAAKLCTASLGVATVCAATIVGTFAGTAAADAGGPVPGVVGGGQLGAAGTAIYEGYGLPALPPISATSFVIADATSGQVLAAKAAHQKLAPASTLKALTALTLIPKLGNLLPAVAASDAPSEDGTKAGIVAGTTYRIDDLFTAMLMMSANDAAVTLADANGGVAETLAQMNALASKLQAGDTVAMTPDGLDAAGQTSSAYDLALIFRAGLDIPQFRHYLALRSANFPAPNGTSFQIQTHDRLLTDYPGMIGGKNGYTVAAQASYVGAATRNGRTIIVSVMRDQANFWPEVKSMLDWGFAADGVAIPVGALVGPIEPTTTPAPVVAAPAVEAAPAVAPAVVPATAPKAAAHQASSGTSISPTLIWSAAGVAALFLLFGVWQLATRRRRYEKADTRYLAGLSRLSGADEYSSKTR
jgi:D-alanyl-D-alanine carboxypeptidase (penicillin-binding protein 5/6)